MKGLSINRLVPNIVTISATCAGLTSIRYAIDENWQYAVTALILSAILDALDGRMARMLKAESEFGAQLDSLSDFVSFGVAPAFVMYFWSLQHAGGLGWAVALIYIICCGLRLARFNSMIGKLPPYAYNYFTGVPAPAGALLSLLPIVLGFNIAPEFLAQPLVVGPWMMVMAVLMVSPIPTFSFKRLKVPQRWVVPVLIAVGMFMAGLAGYPWITLSLCALLYFFLIPFSVRSFLRLKDEAERLHEEQPPVLEGPESDE
ncbi:MAG: CDP-diacylglycerol--serine O-phosphatidyltransferase [Alphaproteobacteria bacterium]